MKSISRVAVLAATAALLAGCATIVGSAGDALDQTDTTVHTMIIASSPAEATIRITDEHGTEIFTGVTPKMVYLRKTNGYFSPKSYQISISKAGYQTQTVAIASRKNWWYYAGNAGLVFVFFTGVVGWFVVDPSYGY